MGLIDRIAQNISRHTNCPRAFPCVLCNNERDTFEGAGCGVLAVAALSALLPDPSMNTDDDLRLAKIAEDVMLEPSVVLDVVRTWIEEALSE